jgi:hypothetical protein
MNPIFLDWVRFTRSRSFWLDTNGPLAKAGRLAAKVI